MELETIPERIFVCSAQTSHFSKINGIIADMTTTAVRHGYTPAQAVELAEAAVKLSGGSVPAWVRDINVKVAHGELTGDEAVEQIKARITQGSER